MRRTLFARASLMLLLLPVGIGFSQNSRSSDPDASEPLEVGMIALLASPERYEGQKIRTTGFLCIEFEGNALYLHQEDFRHRATKNAVELYLSKTQQQKFKGL